MSLFSIILYYLTSWEFKNSIWRLFHIRMLSSDMWTVDLSANISQWKSMFCNNCIGIYILSL